MKKEFKMSESGLYILSMIFITVVYTFYVYNKRDNTQYQATLDAVELCNSKYKKLEGLISDNIQSVGLNNQRVSSIETKIDEVKQDCKINQNETESLFTQCAQLKEKQIELQEKLSKKRPVIKLEQPIPVEIQKRYPQGVKALIKETSKKAKSLEGR